jgi:hypothetical protein
MLERYFEILIAVLAFVVWLVRLEGKIGHVERLAEEAQKDVDNLRIKHESLDSKIVEQLGEVRESLARLEGALGVSKKGDN